MSKPPTKGFAPYLSSASSSWFHGRRTSWCIAGYLIREELMGASERARIVTAAFDLAEAVAKMLEQLDVM
ncbi:hypothetical protein ACU5AX_20495 [Sphingomonas sp. XXL09]|uniref:hypothetical protein n=1 Tax=Sphingomonas sp. XXL09 TaxID=3457787 RepID=UPI00406BC5D3